MIEIVLVGGFCGALSFWIVSYRLSYAAESLAHGLLPGLVLAALAGAPLLLGAGAGVSAAAALVALAGRDERIGADTATAVVVTGAFGLGGLLALSPDAPARLEELLFGDPLGVGDSDLVAAMALALVGGAALLALHRPLCAVAFDPGAAGSLACRGGARAAGAPGRCWPPRWRWPCRAWGASWSWRCWWRRRWRCAATRQAPAPAWPSARSSRQAPASSGSTPLTTWAAPPVHRWRWRCAPPRWCGAALPGLRRDAAAAGARAGG